jgi:hypothetical protein
VFLAVFSGCVGDEKQLIEARLACMELSTHSLALVPTCTTQQQCFEAIEQRLLKDVDVSLLPQPSRYRFFLFKNALARSWLHMNRAKKNLKNIYALCTSQKLHDLLPYVNELMHNLYVSFEESDNALRYATEFLALETKALSEHDINELRNEPIFEVFVELKYNLYLLSSGKLCKRAFQSHFGCALVESTAYLQNALTTSGFSYKVTRETSLLDLLGVVRSRVTKNDIVRSIYSQSIVLPMFAAVLSHFYVYLWQMDKLGRAVGMMRRFPSDEMFEAYALNSGADSSAAYFFAQLVRSDVNARRMLHIKLSHMHAELTKRARALSLRLKTIIELDKLVDFNVFSSIDANVRFFALRQMPEINADMDQELVVYAKRIAHNQKQLQRLSPTTPNIMSFGKRMRHLRMIEKELEDAERVLSIFEQRILEYNMLCEAAASHIKTTMHRFNVKQRPELLSSLGYAYSFASARVLSALKNFNNAGLLKQRMLECSSMLNYFAELLRFVKNQTQEALTLEAEITSAKRCLSDLRVVLQHYDFSTTAPELVIYANKLLLLESRGPDNQLVSLSGKCAEVRYALLNLINTEEGLEELYVRYRSIAAKLDQARIHAIQYPNYFSSAILKRVEATLSHLPLTRGGFSEVSLLPKLTEIRTSLKYAERLLDEFYLEGISRMLVDTASVEHFSPMSVTLDEDFNVIYRMELHNPVKVLNSPLTVSINAPFCKTYRYTLISAPKNVDVRCSDDRVMVTFSRLPLGLTVLEFAVLKRISYIRNLSFARIDLNTAVVRVEYVLKKPLPDGRLRLRLPYVLYGRPVTDIQVVDGVKEAFVDHDLNAYVLTFSPYADTSRVVVLLFLSRPLDFSYAATTLLDTPIYQSVLFTLKLENRMLASTPEVALSLPLNIPREAEVKSLYVGASITRKYNVTPEGLNVSIPSMPPHGMLTLKLYLELPKDSNHWISQLKNLQPRIRGLYAQKHVDKAALERIERKWYAAFRMCPGKACPERVTSIASDISALESTLAEYNNLDAQISRLYASIESKLSELSKLALKARASSLPSLASFLEQSISETKNILVKIGERRSPSHGVLRSLRELDAKLLTISHNKLAEHIDAVLSEGLKSVDGLVSKLANTPVDENLDMQLQTLYASERTVRALASRGSMWEAVIELAEFSQNLKQFSTNVLKHAAGVVDNHLEMLVSFFDTCAALDTTLETWHNQLASVSEEELLEAAIFPPMSKSTFESIKRRAERYCHDAQANRYREILKRAPDLSDSEKLDLLSFMPKLSVFLERKGRLNRDLQTTRTSLLALKQRAEHVLNQINTSQPYVPVITAKLAEDAKKELNRENYLKALVLGVKAQRFLDSKTKEARPNLLWLPLLSILLAFVAIKLAHASSTRKSRPKKLPKIHHIMD